MGQHPTQTADNAPTHKLAEGRAALKGVTPLWSGGVNRMSARIVAVGCQYRQRRRQVVGDEPQRLEAPTISRGGRLQGTELVD